MEKDVKIRLKKNRRRERAERMNAQRENVGDSGEDEAGVVQKPPRPPLRRKKTKEAPYEEDIVDGFAILAFRSYEELETAVKMASQKNGKLFSNLTLGDKTREENRPPIQRLIHRRSPVRNHDAGTSDDNCGRASEMRPSVGPRNNRDSSHDRLSDASSRCSSGRGYICDSEGEDDKGSVAGDGPASPDAHDKKKKKGKTDDEEDTTPTKTEGSDAGSVYAATPASTPRQNEPTPTPLTNGVASPPGPGRPTVSPVVAGPGPPPSTNGLPSPRNPVPHFQTPPKTRLDLTDRHESVQTVADKRTLESSNPVVRPAAPIVCSEKRLDREGPARDAALAHAPVSSPAHGPAIPNAAPPGAHSHSPALPNIPPHQPAAHPGSNSVPAYSPVPAKKPLVARPPTSVPITTSASSPSPHSISHLTTPTSTVAVAQHPGLPPSSIAPHPGLMPSRAAGSPTVHPGYGLPPMSNAPYPAYPPLYAPYSSTMQHSPYLPPRVEPPMPGLSSPVSKGPVMSGPLPVTTATASAVVTTATTSMHRDNLVAPTVGRTHSPRGHSPSRERDSYSSNVSSLSRTSVTPVSGAPSPYAKGPVWVANSGAPQGRHPSSFPPPMFPPPQIPAPPAPGPFSAESLFQTSKNLPVLPRDQADLLRRELDNRFLASQERSMAVGPAYLRTEMHHHQHQHTHVHQHQGPSLFPKIGPVESPFYRAGIGALGGMGTYPTFTPGLLGSGMPSTPFAPPSHLPTFTPKQVGDVTKPRILKTGKWNAMHVRVAWEIYHNQQKHHSAEGKGPAPLKDPLLRPAGHLFPPPGPRHDLPAYGPGFLPPSHLGSNVSPFSRYPTGSFGAPPPTGFPTMGAFPPRDMPPMGSMPSVHEHWRLRAPSGFAVGPPWSLKPEPSPLDRREMEEREREREREREKERIRREREERERDRERREREEKRKMEAERERREKERREHERRELERLSKARERSPLRNGEIKEEPRTVKEEDVMVVGRTPGPGPYPHPYSALVRHQGLRPPPMAPPFGPPSWPPPPTGDPYAYRRLEQLRYDPMLYRSEEEQRAKMYSLGPFLPPPHHQPSPPSLMKKEDAPGR